MDLIIRELEVVLECLLYNPAEVLIAAWNGRVVLALD